MVGCDRDSDFKVPAMYEMPARPTLSAEDCIMLSASITDQEIKESLFKISDMKSPGPDGFGSGFFKAAWSVISHDFCTAVRSFFQGKKLPTGINSTLVALIPKISNPKYAKEFRPIACCTVVYKTITGILAGRMKGIMTKIIGEEQGAFVASRDIAHNILLAQSLISGYSRKNISPRCALKIDLCKAFDTIERPFLLKVMADLGFPQVIISWIDKCIARPYYSLQVNGSSEGYFAGKRGIRQGDPLSPYLFDICMEYLSRHLKVLASTHSFKLHPKCQSMRINHLMFADDLFLFCKADRDSLQQIKHTLHQFGAVSGLLTSAPKSNIYIAGVPASVRIELAAAVGFNLGSLPVKYLGVPLDATAIRKSHCTVIIEKITQRIRFWTTKFLSYAGRVLLVKSVLQALSTHWCRIFHLPVAVLKEIDILCRRFLWTGKGDASKKSMVAWSNVCAPKSKGGLGIRSASHLNSVLLTTQLWDLHHQKESLWIRWVHTKILRGAPIWQMEVKTSLPWTVRKILDMRGFALSCCEIEDDGALVWACSGTPYTPSSAMHAFNRDLPEVDWYPFVWSRLNYPKHVFIMWLACWNRLPTKVRLFRMNMVQDELCPLCLNEAESRDHLFFHCSTAGTFIHSLLQKLGLSPPNFVSWEDCIQWTMDQTAVRGVREIISLCFSATVYRVWSARNEQIFRNQAFDSIKVWKKIVEDVKLRVVLSTRCINSILPTQTIC